MRAPYSGLLNGLLVMAHITAIPVPPFYTLANFFFPFFPPHFIVKSWQEIGSNRTDGQESNGFLYITHMFHQI